jgi:hypothetical protein
MPAVGAVGAKGVDVGPVHFAGAGDGRVAVGGDDHHLFREHRQPLQARMHQRAVDKRGAQAPSSTPSIIVPEGPVESAR